MKRTINKIIEYLVDIVYPPRCAVCNTILPLGQRGICSNCASKLEYVEEPFCLKCGKPIDDDSKEYCSCCLSKDHLYIQGRAVFVYDDAMRKSIYRFKYNSKREYASFYGQILYDRLGEKIMSWEPEALIPVPIHKKRMHERGYNQATLIANELSKHLKIPVENHIIVRKTYTQKQKDLAADERENNLKKAFIVNKNSVKLKSVVIVDDIYTTGSTVDAISRVLIEAGVEKIYFVALCIGRGI